MASELKRVLVGTDFSSTAAAALTRGARLVRPSGGGLELMHVLSLRDAPDRGRDARRSNSRSIGPDAVSRMQVLAAETNARFGVPVKVHLAFGAPHVELAARAEVTDAGLLVIGAHGERVVWDMFIGRQNLRAPLVECGRRQCSNPGLS